MHGLADHASHSICTHGLRLQCTGALHHAHQALSLGARHLLAKHLWIMGRSLERHTQRLCDCRHAGVRSLCSAPSQDAPHSCHGHTTACCQRRNAHPKLLPAQRQGVGDRCVHTSKSIVYERIRPQFRSFTSAYCAAFNVRECTESLSPLLSDGGGPHRSTRHENWRGAAAPSTTGAAAGASSTCLSLPPPPGDGGVSFCLDPS